MMILEKLPKFEADQKLVRRIDFLWAEWQRAYPTVDLKEQLQWAHAYLVSSGKRYTDMARYLNNWFKRCELWAKNTPAIAVKPFTKPYKEPEPEGEIMSGEDWLKMRRAIRNERIPQD